MIYSDDIKKESAQKTKKKTVLAFLLFVCWHKRMFPSKILILVLLLLTFIVAVILTPCSVLLPLLVAGQLALEAGGDPKLHIVPE